MVLTRLMAINTLRALSDVVVMALTDIKISPTASTINPMAENQVMVRRKATVMMKATAMIEAMERLMSTSKRKVTAAKRATVPKKDMERAKMLAKRRATDMIRATVLKILTEATKKSKVGQKEKYTVNTNMLMAFMMTKNKPTAVTLNMARNRTTATTKATVARIDMLVERLTAIARNMATRKSDRGH